MSSESLQDQGKSEALEETESLPRRQFLLRTSRVGAKICALAGTASFIEALAEVTPDSKERPRPPQQPPKMETKIQNTQSTVHASVDHARNSLLHTLCNSQETAILRTLAESVAEFYVASFAGSVLQKCDLETGNKRYPDLQPYEQTYGRGFKAAKAGVMLVAAPIAEEWAFRLLPTMLWLSQQEIGDRWDVGIATSLAFAYTHNFPTRPLKIGPMVIPCPTRKFRWDSIPIHQFTLGLYTWFAMRRRGYSHAVLAHATHNLCCSLPRIRKIPNSPSQLPSTFPETSYY